jgi:hypothetical protein
MSGSTTQPQAPQNFIRQLAEDTAAVNQKIWENWQLEMT